MTIHRLALVAAVLASCGGGPRTPVAPVDRRAAPEEPIGSRAAIASVGRMTLRPLPEGRGFVVASDAYLVGCGARLSVARLSLGKTTPAAALEAALAHGGFTCVEEMVDRADGRLVIAGLVGDANAVVAWDGRAIEPSATPDEGPARLVISAEEALSGELSTEEVDRGRIVIEPADRYPRAAAPVVRMRGQLRLANGGLVVIGHVAEGLLAAETWRKPGDRGRVEVLPGAPPWTNWDPSLSPRAARLAAPLPGHACVVPTFQAETMNVKYLACFDGERWREIETAPLDGVVTSLAAAEGWIWATTASDPVAIYRLRLGGAWERVGEIAEAEQLTVRMRSAREVYLSDGTSNWVALEAP